MTKITVSIKMAFGDIEVSGEDAAEVLKALKSLDHDFVSDVNEQVSNLINKKENDALKGIVEMSRDGPIIVTNKDLSHYESIGLILYCAKDHQAASREIKRRLAASGKEVTVPARLHEMRSRGYIFKPVENASVYRLSVKGIKWIEDDVLTQLKKK